MKIFKLSQEINKGWDTYDSVVVCAESEDEAIKIHPSKSQKIYWRDGKWLERVGIHWHPSWGKAGDEIEVDNHDMWVEGKDISKLKVEYLGEAGKSVKKGVILSSFNAG